MSINYLTNQLSFGRELIFDLDNTIYNEKDFLFQAYNNISDKLFSKNKKEIYEYLTTTFEKEGRKFIFNKLLKKFPNSKYSVDDCLIILREYKSIKPIQTYPWFKDFASLFINDFNLKIITNGNPSQQMNKINSIEFPKGILLNEIIYANRFKPKPDPDSFYHLKNWKYLKSPIYIGDSLTDKIYCENLQIEFFDIKNYL